MFWFLKAKEVGTMDPFLSSFLSNFLAYFVLHVAKALVKYHFDEKQKSLPRTRQTLMVVIFVKN